jgi:hypothetical protein
MCESKKKILVPRAQEKKEAKKTSRKTIRATPKIGDFFLSAMVANIHLWALFCN